jgi:hypothetical protein
MWLNAYEMFSKNKARLDQESAPLEKLRGEIQERLTQQTATQEQVVSVAGFVRSILDRLQDASIVEKRQVLETIDCHVVYRDAEQMRIFFDLPGEDTGEYRWHG